MRLDMRSGANSSVSDDATASTRELSRTSVTYASHANRTPGRTPARIRSRTWHSDGLSESLPELEAAVGIAVAVVIVDPTDPRSRKCRILRLGEDQRVFDRDARLIVVAIDDPRAQLRGRQLPLVSYERGTGADRGNALPPRAASIRGNPRSARGRETLSSTASANHAAG